MAKIRGVRLVMKGDVRKADRRVLTRKADWALQACRLEPTEDKIYLKVGTFGIGLPSYWWHRLFGGPARLVYYCMFPDVKFWQLVFADDDFWAAQGPRAHEALLLALLVMLIYGIPFAYDKFSGGVDVECVGYWIDMVNQGLGLSDRRAAWVVGWLIDTIAEKTMVIARARGVLGRQAFAGKAIEEFKQFLGHLRIRGCCSSERLSVHPRCSDDLRILTDHLSGRTAIQVEGQTCRANARDDSGGRQGRGPYGRRGCLVGPQR